MTADEAIALSSFQRPGVKLIVGAELAREETIPALSKWHLHQLPGDPSWQCRELRFRLGFVPSSWAKAFSSNVKRLFAHNASDAEWRWLHGPASLEDACAWARSLESPD